MDWEIVAAGALVAFVLLYLATILIAQHLAEDGARAALERAYADQGIRGIISFPFVVVVTLPIVLLVESNIGDYSDAKEIDEPPRSCSDRNN
jgi:hypothetical protein